MHTCRNFFYGPAPTEGVEYSGPIAPFNRGSVVPAFIASPENATQRYLYRARLDGSKTERVTPANQPGTHTYDISPDAHWAFHTVSRFDSPGQSDLVSLPEHKVVRVLNDNATLKAKVGPILEGRTEMVHIPVGTRNHDRRVADPAIESWSCSRDAAVVGALFQPCDQAQQFECAST